MSGIYIPGMEMPTSCSECGVRHEAKCSFYYELLNENEDLYDFRKPDCPLIPVPPHGRLIDADALQQSIKESIDECHKWADEVEGGEMYARVSQSLGTFVECSLRIKAAPTIIEEEVNK